MVLLNDWGLSLTLQFPGLDLETFLPGPLVLVPDLHDVLSERGSAIARWWLPFELAEVNTPVKRGRLVRLAGWIEGVLGNDGLVSLQIRGFTILVDCPYSELVLLALAEWLHSTLACWGSASRQPLSSEGIQLFNFIVFNWRATIILWRVPLELAAVLGDVKWFQRTFRGSWLALDNDLNVCLVLATSVLGLDGILANHVTLGWDQHQLCVVSTVRHLDHFCCLDLLSIEEPGLLRIRLTRHIDLNNHLLVDLDCLCVKVGSVDLRRSKPGLHEVRCGVLAGIAKASLVLGLCSELVLFARSKVLHLTIGIFLGLHPWPGDPVVSASFSVLNCVMGDRGTIFSEWRSPLQLD